MVSAWPIVLFLVCMTVGILTILVTGFLRIEAERAHAREDKKKLLAGRKPLARFVDRVGRTRVGEPLEAAVMARFQGYLAREQDLAADFVSEPSVAKLYTDAARKNGKADLEDYLRNEQQLAEEFVSEPSVENLHRLGNVPAWLN